MTLIITYINKFGVIHASDSNLTSQTGNSGFGQKVFPIPYLNAGLSYSGSYEIGGENLDIWMNELIKECSFIFDNLKEFTENLSERLSSEMRDSEIAKQTIIHIAGYPSANGISHLEFWHISNTQLGSDGNYLEAQSQFHFHNDFNSEMNENHKELLRYNHYNERKYLMYINGFPSGRIPYMMIKSALDKTIEGIWDNNNWKFRQPKSLFETSILIKLYFEFISKLFILSEYSAQYIGGEIQTHLIPAPNDLDIEIV